MTPEYRAICCYQDCNWRAEETRPTEGDAFLDATVHTEDTAGRLDDQGKPMGMSHVVKITAVSESSFSSS